MNTKHKYVRHENLIFKCEIFHWTYCTYLFAIHRKESRSFFDTKQNFVGVNAFIQKALGFANQLTHCTRFITNTLSKDTRLQENSRLFSIPFQLYYEHTTKNHKVARTFSVFLINPESIGSKIHYSFQNNLNQFLLIIQREREKLFLWTISTIKHWHNTAVSLQK